jgi:hypothetical protein
MRRLLYFVLCLTLLAGTTKARAGEIIDRIVAVVSRGVVLQSDLDIAVRYQALIEGRSLKSITDQDLRSTLDRLIDQQLLFEEMGDAGSFALSDEDARKKVAEVRAQFPEVSSDETWRALLLRYGLDEQILQERIKTQVEVMRFVDLRLRPNVRIEDSDIESYYRDQFLPRLRQTGGGDVQLDQVSGRIRQLLTERRIDELLSAWLHNLREQSHIKLDLDTAPDVDSHAAEAASKDPSSTGASKKNE